MDSQLDFALRTAKGAGRILMRYFGRIEHVKHKQVDSIVTEADVHAEDYIRRKIDEAYPEHRVFGEEEGLDARKVDFTWVVDPLDGTTNFAVGLPLFAVSIALYNKRKPVLGAIYEPVSRRSYWATADSGAMCDGEPMRVSGRGLTPTTMVVLGSTWNDPDKLHIPQRLLTRFKTRNFGSAVLQLISVAAGQTELAISDDVRLWDVAAAAFLVEQAGGKVSTFEGERLLPLKNSIEYYAHNPLGVVATNKKVHSEVMRDLVKK